MSIRRFLAIVAVSAFLIGTLAAANAFAQGWKPIVDDHENRIGDLETNDDAQVIQLGDHESRIEDAENKNTTQDNRLDTLEQEQKEQNNRLDALESQPPTAGGIKVFDSSDPTQFVGMLVGIFPTGYVAPGVYREVEASFTVYVPDLGKFIELNRTGEIITTRFRFEYVYYKVDGCDAIEGTYAIPHPWNEVLDSAFIAAHRFYIPAEGNTWTYYTVGDQQEVQLESSHDGSSCDDSLSDLLGAFTLTEVTLPFTLPLTPPLRFQ